MLSDKKFPIRMISWLLFVFSSVFFVISCGEDETELTPEKEVSGETEETTGDTNPTNEEEKQSSEPPSAAKLAAFRDNIKPGLEQGCLLSGCHVSQPIAGSVLEAGNDILNRQALLDYIEKGNGLFKKISNEVSHGGSDQSAALPLDKINAWLAVEYAPPATNPPVTEEGNSDTTDSSQTSSESSEDNTDPPETTLEEVTGPLTYSIGGSISGLSDSITIRLNSLDPIVVNANGSFVFTRKLPSGDAYSVAITAQPTGKVCVLTSGSGTISESNIDNITITCTDAIMNEAAQPFDISVLVSGLSGSLVLQNNGADDLSISSNGSHTFATQVLDGNAYSVSIATQPTGQSCVLSSESGLVNGSNVTGIGVTCSASLHSVGGTVAGLRSGSVTLEIDSGGQAVTVNSSTSFSFSTLVAYNSSYDVAITSQPSGHLCNVSNASGTVAANVSDISVTCNLNDAATAFLALMQPALSGTCSSCHGGTSSGSLHNIGSDAGANRTTLQNYVTANSGSLFKNKVSNTVSHSGGNRTGVLPLADIDIWLGLEGL